MKEMALELAMRMERKTEQMALELTMELAMRMIKQTKYIVKKIALENTMRMALELAMRMGRKNGTNGTRIEDGTGNENDATNQPDIQGSPTQ